jgi:hypothetical protein
MLVEGVPDLYGRVDLLTEDSDSLVVTDIKTSAGEMESGAGRGCQRATLLYSHLASEISPGKKIATRFLVLTKTKEPVVEEHVREVEPAERETHLGGRGAGLAGYRGRGCSIRPRSPVRHAAIGQHVLRVMRLSGRRVGRGLSCGLPHGRLGEVLIACASQSGGLPQPTTPHHLPAAAC